MEQVNLYVVVIFLKHTRKTPSREPIYTRIGICWPLFRQLVTRRKPMQRERDIEKWMREKIEQLGGQFMKWVSPGNDGVPDRIAILPGGDVYFIELKTDQGHSTKIQEWQQQRLRRLGCNVREVRGMTEARQFIEEVVDRAIYTAQLSTESD